MSAFWLDRARHATPGGAQTASKFPERFPQGGPFPMTLRRGVGASVEDDQGRMYVDWICGLASMTLGYQVPEITAAVTAQLQRGQIFSLTTDLEVRVAEQLAAVIPCAARSGSVRFVKSGSEASEAVVRVARRATGREHIVTIGYHAWHAQFAAVLKDSQGVPEVFKQVMHQAPYNDLDTVRQLLTWYDCAAVYVEPVLTDPPAHGYLEGLRRLCSEAGALLIFDEIVTGFRWARGGAQEYFQVNPDLATFGKAMANGFPLAAIVGPRDLMQHAQIVSGTFGGEQISLAVLEAVLQIYQTKPIIEHLWSHGALFLDAAAKAIRLTKTPFEVAGYPPHPVIRCALPEAAPTSDQAARPQYLQMLLVERLAAHGVLYHPLGGNASAALTSEELTRSLEALTLAFTDVRRFLDGDQRYGLQGTLGTPSPLRG